ncbi:PREDICTED: toll-like receptor 4 [Nicrophorus vespilloides]|uniref:Toll-like receptor 4 n=1 Tax=Nicrophorus vespilloides TaxID=110193 RepID=A0ABM1N621_NICVS|nr:PREDICTED: toll-like receptor 4 [Nicrophorus vespilloides]
MLLYYKEVHGRMIEVDCTSSCYCDLYEGLRRANCDNSKLLNVDGNVPSYTEVLEMSFNYLTILNNRAFERKDLESLKLINMSHNKLQDIRIYAFQGMENLKTLDLSYNSLQYVLMEWFWYLPILEEFYLNNNNLGDLKQQPLFESNTLKVLGLASCQIPYMHSDVLSLIPNLEHLDIRGNYLLQLNPNVIKAQKSIKFVDIKDNMIKCEKVSDFNKFCTINQIQLDHNYCQVKEQKFQRIIEVKAKPKEQNSWIINEVLKQDNITECPICDVVVEPSLLLEIIELSPTLAIIISLSLGIFIGIIIGCTVECPGVSKRSTVKRNYHAVRTFDNDYQENSLLGNIYTQCESTPMTIRRS